MDKDKATALQKQQNSGANKASLKSKNEKSPEDNAMDVNNMKGKGKVSESDQATSNPNLSPAAKTAQQKINNALNKAAETKAARATAKAFLKETANEDSPNEIAAPPALAPEPPVFEVLNKAKFPYNKRMLNPRDPQFTLEGTLEEMKCYSNISEEDCFVTYPSTPQTMEQFRWWFYHHCWDEKQDGRFNAEKKNGKWDSDSKGKTVSAVDLWHNRYRWANLYQTNISGSCEPGERAPDHVVTRIALEMMRKAMGQTCWKTLQQLAFGRNINLQGKVTKVEITDLVCLIEPDENTPIHKPKGKGEGSSGEKNGKSSKCSRNSLDNEGNGDKRSRKDQPCKSGNGKRKWGNGKLPRGKDAFPRTPPRNGSLTNMIVCHKCGMSGHFSQGCVAPAEVIKAHTDKKAAEQK
ncbi:hypothetical protein M427DRAFT_39848 [Gonapodya prolifera JEL478]|uniref:CCHC-type domain-containing protein n=1 Tax=Gonapodya prolifera (strain JEL478) TaxID=1344416 RepID=A0A138ZWL3_GONPJ|nr:hypothetical protein M427DRAFT_39848 [Gonapodya prolifera JEL478]|eukprot:KXS08887.1 hypothetical protein M427DRAFT_39848 [Gonapodya prolifera JEL478]